MATKLSIRIMAISLGAIILSAIFTANVALAQGPPKAIKDNVGPYTAVPANVPDQISFKYMPVGTLNTLWIGEVINGCNLRTGPGPEYSADRAWQKGRRVLVYNTVTASTGYLWYQVSRYPETDLYIWSDCVRMVAPMTVPTPSGKATGKWVDVNLTQQVLIAYENSKPVLVSQISSGKKGFETPVGSWRLFWRLKTQDMDGGGVKPGDTYYNMKDVPWVQYFHQDGDALHGVYWHDNFGTPMSHGCVGLSYENSNWLFLWAANGTRVEVHY